MRTVDDLAGYGADIDDAAALAVDHVPAEHLAPEPQRVEVHVEDPAPLLVGDLQCWAVDACAGVVDEHIYGAELVDRRGENAFDLRSRRDVGNYGLAPPTDVSQFLLDLYRRRLISPDGDDVGASFGQGAGEGSAQPSRRAGDDRCTASQIEP